MLFSEVYGSYFNTVSAILEEAVNGSLSAKRINEIVSEKGFGESLLSIPAELKSGRWPLISSDFTTPLKHVPCMPLTTLQKRWMKALLSDPRIKLFSPSASGLENVEPLYTHNVFIYFDRYLDGDPFEDEAYIENFHKVLKALREKRKLRVTHLSRHGINGISLECVTSKLEYSPKDDKFRLIAFEKNNYTTINISRIIQCELLPEYESGEYNPVLPSNRELIMELTNERNAMERAMLHFSHLEKVTERFDDNRYRITLRYNKDDETEMLIRVLSFGPMIKVISPNRFIDLIRERIQKQNGCEL